MRPYSLTRRLIVTLLLVELLSAATLSAATALYEHHLRFHAFDIMLRGRADSLLGDVQDAEDTQDNVMLDGTEINFPAEDFYQVQDASGRILGHSANWPEPGSSVVQQILAAPYGKCFRVSLHHRHYRALRIEGLRMVDPGDKGGGIPRHVSIVYGAPSDGVWRDIWAAAGTYAAISFALLAISGWLIFWLLHRGLSPLRSLAVAASGVSVDSWNFAPPQQARVISELVPLTTALETLVTRLEGSFSQQRRFVGDAAHELKTAVAVLKSSLQLLMLKQRTAAEYERGIERCHLDCYRLEEAVLRMLTLARVEATTALPASHFTTDLCEILQQAVQQFASMAELKQLRILVAASHPVPVDAEPEQLQLLCGNLLLNALQHSAAGAEVRASVLAGPQQATLTIADDGDGIAPQDLPFVFDRFYRVDPSRSRNTGGTGLGLAICKAIVVAAQGTIELQSEPHKGTTVTVQFPGVNQARIATP